MNWINFLQIVAFMIGWVGGSILGTKIGLAISDWQWKHGGAQKCLDGFNRNWGKR